MPQVSSRFGPYPLQVVLDANGNGTVYWQAVGANHRISNLSVKVSTDTNQAQVNLYKGQIGDGNRVGGTFSGSTGQNGPVNIDLFDGEILYVVWTGGDPGATAYATFSGNTIPFDQVGTAAYTSWVDSVAAADGTLIFPAIKSPDYVAGVSGWSLNRNGDAEFNDVTVRGELLVTGPNGSSLHAYVTSVVSDGVTYTIPVLDTDPGQPNFTPGSLFTYWDGSFERSILESPGFDNGIVSVLPARIMLRSGNAGTTQNAIVTDSHTLFVQRRDANGNVVGGNLAVNLNGTFGAAVTVGTTVSVGPDIADIGRGFVAGAILTANSADVTSATETVMLTCVNRAGGQPDFRNDRLFRITISGNTRTTVLASQPFFRIRKTNTAGQEFCNFRIACPVVSSDFGTTYTTYFKTGIQVSADIILTLTGVGGATMRLSASATNPFTVRIDDIDVAPVSGHPFFNVPTLV